MLISPTHEVCDSPVQAAPYRRLWVQGFISDPTLGSSRSKDSLVLKIRADRGKYVQCVRSFFLRTLSSCRTLREYLMFRFRNTFLVILDWLRVNEYEWDGRIKPTLHRDHFWCIVHPYIFHSASSPIPHSVLHSGLSSLSLGFMKCLPKRRNLNSADSSHLHRICEVVSVS